MSQKSVIIWTTIFLTLQKNWAEGNLEGLVKQGCYVSVNSKPDHLPGRPQGIRTFLLPGGSEFRPTFFARGVGVSN